MVYPAVTKSLLYGTSSNRVCNFSNSYPYILSTLSRRLTVCTENRCGALIVTLAYPSASSTFSGTYTTSQAAACELNRKHKFLYHRDWCTAGVHSVPPPVPHGGWLHHAKSYGSPWIWNSMAMIQTADGPRFCWRHCPTWNNKEEHTRNDEETGTRGSQDGALHKYKWNQGYASRIRHQHQPIVPLLKISKLSNLLSNCASWHRQTYI